MGQDQVSGGESVLCWLAAPVAMFYGNLGIVTPGQNYTLKYDPKPMSQFNVESWLRATVQREIITWGDNLTWNQDPGSQFNVESWHGVKFQRESWPGSQFNVESWPGVTFQRVIMTPGLNSTLNYDPGSELHIELWSQSWVTI